MSQVRSALDELETKGVDLWSATPDGRRSCRLLVDAGGQIVTQHEESLSYLTGQQLLPKTIDLLAAFEESTGARPGPDLVVPRSKLRIVPGRLAGEPHLEGTRIGSLEIHALALRGFSVAQIASMYDLSEVSAVEQAIDLEHSLGRAA